MCDSRIVSHVSLSFMSFGPNSHSFKIFSKTRLALTRGSHASRERPGMTNQVSERAHTHMRFDCNVQAAAAAAGAVATADASPLRVRESVSPGFGKDRIHLGCVEHTRERCESEASTLQLPPAPSLPLLVLLLPILRAPGSSGFESAVPSGGVGALPEGTAWG